MELFITLALQSAPTTRHAAVSMSLCAIHVLSGAGEGGWRGRGGLEAKYTAGGKLADIYVEINAQGREWPTLFLIMWLWNAALRKRNLSRVSTAAGKKTWNNW